MRSSQGYRHTRRPALPALARERHPSYDPRRGAAPVNVPSATGPRDGDPGFDPSPFTHRDGGVAGAVSMILADHEGAPVPEG
ncbi:MAG: hypothetical protein WEB03_11140, partial [Nitriliruptor sp.]|uniref:hypothetical protein n=1 Tax=Nitriliruptor sp. TaxID=2448056 RepID=UPI00349FD406